LKNLILAGNKVVLRKPGLEDIPKLYELIYGVENPEWKQFDAPYFPHESISLEKFQESMEKRINKLDIPSMLVIEVNGEMIGDVTFYWEYQPTRWLEVGIVIFSPKHWSGGYGTEALTLWIDYLFSQLEIARVGLTTWSGNPRMIRCAEKLGMQLEGRMRKCRYYNGEYYDSIRMGILREEWEARKVN
jgi:RimJ/RimL family protein N-acetyltransferase